MLPNLSAAPFTLYFWSIHTSKHTMACTQGSLTKSSFSTTSYHCPICLARPAQTNRYGRYDVSTGFQCRRSTILSYIPLAITSFQSIHSFCLQFCNFGRFCGRNHDRNGLLQFQMIKQAKQRPSPMTLYHRHMWD